MTSIIADYEFCEPNGSAQIAIRDQMLQEILRPGGAMPYPIAAEYPLVLAPSRTNRSLCIARRPVSAGREGINFLAHANILLRKMEPAQLPGLAPAGAGIKVALVGNVATAPDERGKGLMRKLMDEVESRARAQGADAIVLWSDLSDFYQKLGFSAGGNEIRMTLSVRKLDSGKVPFIWVPEGAVSDEHIARMLELRATGFRKPLYQIERSIAEFRELLGIPDLALIFACRGNFPAGKAPQAGDIQSFFIVGKGADMQGVIHEWGTSDMQLLMNAAGAIAGNAGLGELMILVPPSTDTTRIELLTKASVKRETHPMAWVKILSPERKTLVELAFNEGFIWGLDSI